VDFYKIKSKEMRDGSLQLYPDFVVTRSKDLMVRGRSFYAIWDEEANLWDTDEYSVQRIVDKELHEYAAAHPETRYTVMNLKSFNTKSWSSYRNFIQIISDNSHPLDEKLIFANTEVKKTDYASRRLPYSLGDGPIDAWDELVGTLYSKEERAKIEWAIGAIVSGDSKKIQKFLVFYGPAGSGKSTILNIIQKLFVGYVTTFDAKALGSGNNAFSTEVFKGNPLVAIQHDGDLSKISDNTKLNSIISHEDMTMNEKYKPSYSARVNAFLLIGTNQPVKISDAKSGIIRRLIDVHPTGVKINSDRYHILLDQIDFELGSIAQHCLNVYREMGKNYYNAYKPLEMMLQTDVFFNFVEAYYEIFREEDGVSLKRAYGLYKEFCSDTGIEKVLPQYKFREELRNYFDEFKEQQYVDGEKMRSYYSGFKGLDQSKEVIPDTSNALSLFDGPSVFDIVYSDAPAQYGKESGYPGRKWENVKTKLSDIDTTKLHFVKVPEHHIVIDFDLVDENGEKDLDLNIAAASRWPATYTELSKSGHGVHLHYIYVGDVTELTSVYDTGIEVKTLLGDSSLRRKLTKSNNLEIATISSGLPKKERRVLDTNTIKSEKGLRDLIDRNLRKEIHSGTKPSVDFIEKILEDAWDSDLSYDVRDLRPIILAFAAKSSNQSSTCIKTVQRMKFVGKNSMPEAEYSEDGDLAFFDVEVYPNLFVVCWKYEGESSVVKMINPTPNEIEPLFSMRLVGFNNRRYDNHILYARFLGYSLEELYNMSVKIIANVHSAMIGEAYNISYTDIYDFSSKKQGLKKFEIDLGIHHMEMDLPWDQPVPEDRWNSVVEYCANDVIATEAVFMDRQQDFVARQILADLSGLSVNHTTQNHTAKIIFGDDKEPQKKFVYTDLSQEFKGYQFTGKESIYRGEVTGEGGYVYSEPGIYENVALLDVASMHPTSIELLKLFGPYTERFAELKEARMAIKHEDYDRASELLGGKLKQYLDNNKGNASDLSYALKIVINIVYGLTSARFDNPFRDNRNVDNIVAKRGALFMIDLKHFVQDKGFQVVHIKTDSIKIPDATKTIIKEVTTFGKKYGYDFEHELTYDKFCLVNDAVYIAKEGGKWTAVGAQFQKPYVFKKLFTNEEIEFEDLCETKSVKQGVMYLDFSDSEVPDISTMTHVGRTGSFVPVKTGGGILYRVKEDKAFAVTGTKGFRWIEREMAENRKDLDVDLDYFDGLKQAAFDAIDYYGHFESFVE
jgi:energy-coupling factor transporter ATP-binding protein EcfA2